MKASIAAAAGALLLVPASAAACTQDLECGSGGRCLKSAGAIYGACVRDVLPSGAGVAPSAPAGMRAMPRQQCTFDADCGAGRMCLKTSADTAGMCVKQQ